MSSDGRLTKPQRQQLGKEALGGLTEIPAAVVRVERREPRLEELVVAFGARASGQDADPLHRWYFGCILRHRVPQVVENLPQELF
jgi:hypothetical protein